MRLRHKIGIVFKMAAFVVLLVDGVAYGEYAIDHGSLPLSGFILLAIGIGLFAIGEKFFPENSN